MNSKKHWRIGGIITLLFALAALIVVYTGGAQVKERHIPERESKAGAITLTIEGVYASKSVPISRNETILEVLQKLNAVDREVKLQTKEYSGLGTLIESLGEWKNGMDGKYWQYKVNGVMPQVGAGAYQLKDGDVIEWYFGPSLF